MCVFVCLLHFGAFTHCLSVYVCSSLCFRCFCHCPHRWQSIWQRVRHVLLHFCCCLLISALLCTLHSTLKLNAFIRSEALESTTAYTFMQIYSKYLLSFWRGRWTHWPLAFVHSVQFCLIAPFDFCLISSISANKLADSFTFVVVIVNCIQKIFCKFWVISVSSRSLCINWHRFFDAFWKSLKKILRIYDECCGEWFRNCSPNAIYTLNHI